MAEFSEPVKVEIDLESKGFVEVFDNIALGFRTMEKKISRLRTWNLVLTGGLVGYILSDLNLFG